MQTILVCDDDKQIVEAIDIYLTGEGFQVIKAYDGYEALELLENNSVDLMIVDVMMPGLDGIRTTLKVRETSSIPIIILSAKSEDADKILGLNIGADDYITKPFGMLELISRIKAVLRRTSDNPSDYELHAGDITVNPGKHRVMVNGENVILTYKEFEMLCMLIESKGLVLSRNKLLESIWGYDFDGETRTIDVHIRSLRSKLGESGNIIETVRGVGYKIGADYET